MDNWQRAAKSIPTGQKRKVECCSTSPSAYISNDRKGIRFFCFRCGTKHWEPHGPRSIAEVLAARRATDEIKELRDIPSRCIPLYAPETPREAVLWVLQAGLAPETATDSYGFLYDPKTRRVCIPINGGFLARAIFGESPKYIKAGADCELYELPRESNQLVVCEDIMSAIKVYEAGFNSVAILGTAVTTTMAMKLAKHKVIVCWTDGDKAGDQAWIKMRKILALYPVTLTRVRTKEDPKLIHRAEIVRLIQESIDGN